MTEKYAALRPYAWGPSDESMRSYAKRGHFVENSRMFFVSASRLAQGPDLMAYEDHERLLRLINDQEKYVALRTKQEVTWDVDKMQQTVFTFDQLSSVKSGMSNHRVHSLTVLNRCPMNRYYLPCVIKSDRWVVPRPKHLPDYARTSTMVNDALRQVFLSYTGATVRWGDLSTFATGFKAGASDVLNPTAPVHKDVCSNLHGSHLSFSQIREACRWYFSKQRDPQAKYRKMIASCVSPDNKTRGSPEVHEFYAEYPMFMYGRCVFDFQRLINFETGIHELFMGKSYSVVPSDIRTMIML